MKETMLKMRKSILKMFCNLWNQKSMQFWLAPSSIALIPIRIQNRSNL